MMSKNFYLGKNSLIVNLRGEIDQYAAAQLKSNIDIEIENSPKKNLIFDLKEVTLMDSSGIGLIVGRYKLVTSLGGKMMLCNASESVFKMLRLSGIQKVVDIYETLADAEKSLSKQKGR
ncbi:MAG: anti-sigma factor antagonist [Clostridia bacterium]|nr:anti-sigma factor antagonist [Clostridia bacterium]